MPSNSVPFRSYGVLQIVFVIVLYFNFILSVAVILASNDDGANSHTTNSDKNESNSNNNCSTDSNEHKAKDINVKDLILPSLVASAVLLLISFLLLYILAYKARTNDYVGNLRMFRKRSASFKVAFVSWILTSSETILRMIAFFKFRNNTLDYQTNTPWLAIVGYHILLLVQSTFQIYCIYIYEKNTKICREGQSWFITRRSFLILMTFTNCYLWLLNVAKIEVIVDLTSHKMESFFSDSVERIIYTLNRASTLAYHVESAQLFYKFYAEDSESPLDGNQYENLDHDYPDNYYREQVVSETESGKGVWLGFFMFGISVFVAIGSFLVRSSIDDIHYAATLSTVATMLTIFCITLKTTLSTDNNREDEDHDEEYNLHTLFRDITSYMAGEDVNHVRILVFYSVCAISYHFLLAIRMVMRGTDIDVFQPVREACKGVACISLTVFMFWMSHKKRKLRCWRDLNVMFWIVLALLCLEFVEEAFEHDNKAKDSLQEYVLPIAIDFKTYVIIHTFSDITLAKTEYRQELRRQHTTMVQSMTSRLSTPLLA